MLPLSPYHIVAGWLDIIFDIMGVVSTIKIAQQVSRCQPGCGAPPFFWVAAALQIFFLVGNQTTQTIFACKHAAKHGHSVLVAGLRGFFNLQLAHLEARSSTTDGRDEGGLAAATAAALNHKMIELLWEAPMTVVSFSVLQANLILNDGKLGLPLLKGDTADKWAPIMQLVSALCGLVSLSFGALDFMRLHPMSYWAAEAPTKLVLSLIDTSQGTWLRSLLIGVYTPAALISRASMFTMGVNVFGVYPFGAGVFGTPWWLLLMIVSGFIVCMLLLLQLKLRACTLNTGGYELSPAATWLLASALSTFINIPWVTAPVGSDAWKGRYACWPSWVMTFLSASMGMFFGWFFGGFLEYFAIPVIAISTAASAVEFIVFLAMSGWETNRRRRFVAGKADVTFIDKVPPLFYEKNGCCCSILAAPLA